MGPEVTGFEAFLYRLSDFSKALMLPVVLVIPRLSRLATLATVLARTLNYCMLLVSGWPLAVDFSRHWNDFHLKIMPPSLDGNWNAFAVSFVNFSLAVVPLVLYRSL